MNKCIERLYNGIIKENPTFVLMLGMCPTLAVTTTAINGIGMGLSTTAVLVFSNLIISALRKIIPDRVRIPAYIVIVASLVTIVQLLLQAYVPSLYSALGIYIPLIVVNCIILGRAEAYAAKNGPLESAFDGIGMGLGFTVGLTCIAIVRERRSLRYGDHSGGLPRNHHRPGTGRILRTGMPDRTAEQVQGTERNQRFRTAVHTGMRRQLRILQRFCMFL